MRSRRALVLALGLWACDDGGGSPSPAQEGPADAAPEVDAVVGLDAGDRLDAAPDAGPDAAPDAAVDAEVVSVPSGDGCENLEPRHCLLPWPSDRWLVADETRDTGWRLEYDTRAIPMSRRRPVDVAPYRRLDGFSPSSQIMTLFEAPADLSDAATVDHIERSLEPDSPTVVLDLETGERVAHWVENDARATDPAETVLYIRTAQRLRQNAAYGIAIRGLRTAAGDALAPPEAFRALRDGLPTDSPDMEARRPGFDRLFAALDAAGVERAALQQAWWFHTESFRSGHETLMAMRDDALHRLGADGLGCTVTEVLPNFEGGPVTKVRATVTVPWYLDAALAPAVIVRDEAGLPVYQQNREVAFSAVVPRSLADQHAAGPLVVWGHGLFGDADGSIGRELAAVAAEEGIVFAATDWAGMSTKDLPFLGTALADVSKFHMVGDMLQQGVINQIAMTRALLGACRLLPEFSADGASLIDPARRYYIGGSQGSILGGTLLTLSPDFERGVLIVGGTTFSFMIERSIHYQRFEPLLGPSYPSRMDRAVLMAVSQHVWDRAESSAYLDYTRTGLPGDAPPQPKQFIYLVAENDAQVPNLSSHIAARQARLPVLPGSTHVPWGLEVGAEDATSAYIAMDYGDRPTPAGNLAPDDDDGGHNNVGFTAPALSMLRPFLLSGEIVAPCIGRCDVRP